MEVEKIKQSLIVIYNNLERVEVKGSKNLELVLASIVGVQDLINYINENKGE